MVREGGQELGEEAQEDGAVGRAGEGHHHAEREHQVHYHPQVTGWSAAGVPSEGAPSRYLLPPVAMARPAQPP